MFSATHEVSINTLNNLGIKSLPHTNIIHPKTSHYDPFVFIAFNNYDVLDKDRLCSYSAILRIAMKNHEFIRWSANLSCDLDGWFNGSCWDEWYKLDLSVSKLTFLTSFTYLVYWWWAKNELNLYRNKI